MAFSFVKLHNLAIRFSNGHETISVSAVNPTDANQTMMNTIRANPFQFGDRLMARNNVEGPTAVAALEAFSVGTIDLWGDLFDLISANQYFDIYNPLAGTNDFIRFMRVNNNYYSYEVKAWHNGSSTVLYGPSGTLWSSTWNRSTDVPLRPKCGISFLIDEFGMCAYCATGLNIGWADKTQNTHNVYYDYAGRVTDLRIQSCLHAIITGNIEPEPIPPASDEPYGSNDYDISSGGMGPMDDSSDTIEDGVLPLATATMSGMCTVWVPDWGEIQNVADALLDPNIAQILAGNVLKFSDVIIGLSVFPCPVPATSQGTVTVNVLGIEMGTGVTCHIADSQYITIDCGTLDVDEYWCNCLDYNPYTRISIYLPFCGTYELDTDEVMGKTLGVTYRIDIFSGACLATIKIDGSIYYQYAGQCSAQIPISSVSFDNFLSSMLELGVATATGVGAIGAAGGAVKEAEAAFKAGGSPGTGGEALMEAREHLTSVKSQSANSIADAAVGAVMGSKGFYQHAGAMGGSPGFMGVRKPYLIIKRPEQLIPSMYGKFHGFPCNTTAVLGDLTGYTQVDDIRLNIPDATVEEIIECEQLLKGGVVI